jgi:glycosyltransferase involved in cell wall biosynthesis
VAVVIARPTFSVLIPWCDRDVLAGTLAQNRAAFAGHAVEIIVVNAGGSRSQLAAIVNSAGVPNVRTVTLPRSRFNRSLCLNVGALVSRGAYLFLLDADIVATSDILTAARRQLRRGDRFVAVERIVESGGGYPPPPGSADLSFLAEVTDTRELLTVDGRRAVLRRRSSPAGLRGGDGLLLVDRAHFRRIGGLNSRLKGWGFEDTDFQIRLQLGLGLERVEAGDVVHLTHSSAGRDQQSYARNLAACTANYKRRRYKGSLVEDARRWSRALIEATPIAGEAAR